MFASLGRDVAKTNETNLSVLRDVGGEKTKETILGGAGDFPTCAPRFRRLAFRVAALEGAWVAGSMSIGGTAVLFMAVL